MLYRSESGRRDASDKQTVTWVEAGGGGTRLEARRLGRSGRCGLNLDTFTLPIRGSRDAHGAFWVALRTL